MKLFKSNVEEEMWGEPDDSGPGIIVEFDPEGRVSNKIFMYGDKAPKRDVVQRTFAVARLVG